MPDQRERNSRNVMIHGHADCPVCRHQIALDHDEANVEAIRRRLAEVNPQHTLPPAFTNPTFTIPPVGPIDPCEATMTCDFDFVMVD